MGAVSEMTKWSGSDCEIPVCERLPVEFIASFIDDGLTVRLLVDGRAVGNPLTDARRERDGYRFHDAMHLAFAVKLGWSPVLRGMLGCKRRSDPETDECEDGGRACMIEESVCHLIHVYRRDFGDDGWDVLVELIRRVVRGFEVERCSAKQWIEAIRIGLAVQDALAAGGGGLVKGERGNGMLTVFQVRSG
jgi:hypothetical protein